MSNPIKNDGGLGDRVPVIVKVKVKRTVTGEEGSPFDITLTLEHPVNEFYYNVQLQFLGETYDIPPTLVPTINGSNVSYRVKTNYVFPQKKQTINVGLIYSEGILAPLNFKTCENVAYTYG